MNTLFDLDNPPLKSVFAFPQLSDDLCRQAFYWTSFDPDKRGEVFKNEYNTAQETFINFVKAHDITEEQKQDCINYWSNRLYKNAVDYLSAHSRCLSWAITGPAKFPVKKAEKAQKAFEKAGFRFEQAHPDGDAWYYRYDRFSIRPIDRENLQEMLSRLFVILHGNMSVIAPTGNSYEEDEALWCSCIEEAMKKEARQLLVMWDGEAIAGFFMYYTNGSLWMMEEIQIAPAYQGSGLFRALYAYLFATLPDSVESVEAYANKQNQKSIAILKHLGLDAVGESKNGNSYHFRGTYKNLKEALT